MRRAAALLLALLALPAAAEPLTVTDGGPPVPLATRLTGAAALHLWATWCAPCRDELPALAAFLDAHPELSGRVVVLSVDTAPVARVARYLDDLGVALPPLKVASGSAGGTFGVTGYPATLFLDGRGEVVARRIGPLDWHDPAIAAAFAAGR